jgi:hypothetical protein
MASGGAGNPVGSSPHEVAATGVPGSGCSRGLVQYCNYGMVEPSGACTLFERHFTPSFIVMQHYFVDFGTLASTETKAT